MKKYLLNQENHSLLSSYLKEFDCEDSDLNEFLREGEAIPHSALNYHNALLAKTYVLLNEGGDFLVAFYSVLNDKILKKKTWASRFRKELPHQKRYLNDMPAVKIGRFGVDKKYQRQGIGKEIIDEIKKSFASQENKTGCKFITVDSYKDSVDFYMNQGFEKYPEAYKEEKDTIPLFFHLGQIQ